MNKIIIATAVGVVGAIGFLSGCHRQSQDTKKAITKIEMVGQLYVELIKWIPEGLFSMDPDDFQTAIDEKVNYIDIAYNEV